MHVPTILAAAALLVAGGAASQRPNILLAISDDQSWLHTRASGDESLATPAFDRIAREGVRFTHAFAAAPSCTASRSALLTGQAIWRLAEGGVLHGTLPARFEVYPRLLEKAGYRIGYTGKGWGPGSPKAGGRTLDPVGKSYRSKKLDDRRDGISAVDYAANFATFLGDRDGDEPFCFWFGAYEPHRIYAGGRGDDEKFDSAVLPPELPDHEIVRSDVHAYGLEIEHFDRHLGRMLALLDEMGELDRTLVVVTSDHGMPFPRCKANLYDGGVRVPLAIRLPGRIPGARVVDDLVSLTDLAPTFVELGGLKVPEAMTGLSLWPVLRSTAQRRVDASRSFVVTALERHVPRARRKLLGYPMRAVRTHSHLYIRNFAPDRWPAGDRPPHADAGGRAYPDIDDGPTKKMMFDLRETAAMRPWFERAFGKRPAEELYDMRVDPGAQTNLAAAVEHRGVKAELAAALEGYLVKTGDPRMRGEAPWEDYPGRFAVPGEKAKAGKAGKAGKGMR